MKRKRFNPEDSIDVAGFSHRVRCSLLISGITTIGQLREAFCSGGDIASLTRRPNFGKKALEEVLGFFGKKISDLQPAPPPSQRTIDSAINFLRKNGYVVYRKHGGAEK